MNKFNYKLIEYFFRNDIGVLPNELNLKSELQLGYKADFIIGYSTEPIFKYIFEMINVDTELSIVDEILNWCDENLDEYNWINVRVIKNRFGMPKSYPTFETPNELDAVAFKLRWL